MSNLAELLTERILILDGGMGTLIQSHKLSEDHFRAGILAQTYNLLDHPIPIIGLNDILSVTQPSLIADIHRAYLEAGADIISTNTFNSNPISLADYQLSNYAYELGLQGARLARSVADEFKGRFVAGSVGPTGRSASMSPDVLRPGFRNTSFMELAEGYALQIKGLVDGGVDIILLETVFDTLNCKAAIYALRSILELRDFPLMISGTVTDASGRILSGQTLEAFYHSISHAKPMSVGLNCAFGARQMMPYLENLGRTAPNCAISAHPNAGLPNLMGGYDESPEQMAQIVEQYMQQGLINIIGGCCGTTPQYIACLSKIAANYKPRKIDTSEPEYSIFTGLQPLMVDKNSNFINVGERTNVAGSAKFAKLIRGGLFNQALAVAQDQVESGANIIDVCMDDAMIDAPTAMRDFLNLMASEPNIAALPVMIDSSQWETIIEGLRTQQGKAIVNSISLKEGETEFLRRAQIIRDHGAAAVIMLFDEQGQGDTYQRKIEIADRAYKLLRKIDFPNGDIIFDPNILAVATGIAEHDGYAMDFIEACRWIKNNCSPRVLLSGGVSNLSFSFRGNNTIREAMHTVFLYHASRAGMDMAIINPSMIQIYNEIEPQLLALVEDVILNRTAEAAENLIQYATNHKDTGGGTHETSHNKAKELLGPDESIIQAVVKGDTSTIEQDTAKAFELHGNNALEVVDKVLMTGMSRVGELFSQGKMFLPQVVKSARVMKLSVSVLEPHIKASQETLGEDAKRANKVVLATVKGDVHDIGKNIVKIVLECNGYQVIDLGVMTPTETIIEAVVRENPCAIILSGLITPSLEEMCTVAKRLESLALNTPLAIGGATTSELHTAVKIAPLYSGLVAHSNDASGCATLINQIVSNSNFEQQYKEKQVALRQKYQDNLHPGISLAEARERAKRFSFQELVRPSTLGQRITIKGYDLRKLIERIDWNFFLVEWGMKGRYPEILNHPQKGEQAKELIDNAHLMLKEFIAMNHVQANAVYATLAARAVGEDIFVRNCNCCTTEVRLPQSRNLTTHFGSLADMIAPQDDCLTLFALSIANNTTYEDDYQKLMAQILCNRLAEAFATELSDVQCRYQASRAPLRVAIGYPDAPEHAAKGAIFDILDVSAQIPLTLTDTYMMSPGSSISGYMMHHPKAEYFR